jgi:hypothetical protein
MPCHNRKAVAGEIQEIRCDAEASAEYGGNQLLAALSNKFKQVLKTDRAD